MDVVEYLEPSGRSPFGAWFRKLDVQAAAKATAATTQLTQDNMSGVESVGAGVHEYRIHAGPGYRIYFGIDGRVGILLAGGTKDTQRKDIATAKARWKDYKRRK